MSHIPRRNASSHMLKTSHRFLLCSLPEMQNLVFLEKTILMANKQCILFLLWRINSIRSMKSLIPEELTQETQKRANTQLLRPRLHGLDRFQEDHFSGTEHLDFCGPCTGREYRTFLYFHYIRYSSHQENQIETHEASRRLDPKSRSPAHKSGLQGLRQTCVGTDMGILPTYLTSGHPFCRLFEGTRI